MNRFTCSLIYYALALNTGTLYGNIYLNTFLSGLVEIPAYILAIWMMERKFLGRRLTVSLSFLAGGIVAFLCIPLILLSKYALIQTQLITFCGCGKTVEESYIFISNTSH